MEQTTVVVRERSQHCISRRDIDPDALKVLYRLASCGYTAHLVGGAVRDLLLGRKPKDFDVGTDAHPNEIRRLFRNCLLIGRRFRLAHIRFGAKIIETSTFRCEPDEPPDPGLPEHLALRERNNTFGSAEDDARRRDFTINGLFYDIKTFRVIDHVGGLRDLDARVIRTIRDPDESFLDDPVRMVRAVRFASRLGFAIEPATYQAMLRHHARIAASPPARLLEELYKLFGHGTSERAFRLLQETGLLGVMLPDIAGMLPSPERAREAAAFWDCMAALDAGRYDLRSPTPTLIFTTLYWPLASRAMESAAGAGGLHSGAAVHGLLQCVAPRFHMPRRVMAGAVHAILMQRRLAEPPCSGKALRLLRHESFPEALSLAQIRAAGHAELRPAAEAWARAWAETGHRERHGQEARQPGRRRRRGGQGRRGPNDRGADARAPHGHPVPHHRHPPHPAPAPQPPAAAF